MNTSLFLFSILIHGFPSSLHLLDKKNSDPREAVEQFETVIMLEENRSEKKYTFDSLKFIILIKCKLESYDGLTDYVNRILKAMSDVSKNAANDAIDEIVEAVSYLDMREYN